MDKKLVFIVPALVIIFFLEGVYPHFKGRKQRMRHAFPHIVTALLNGLLTGILLAGITLSAAGWADARSLGFLNVLRLPYYAEWITAFILFDIYMYFWHMANHRLSFLWRFHRAHHSDIEMDTTTALRFHPGELILSTFIRLPIIVLLGMSFAQLALYELVLNIAILFHHSNLGIPEKWDRVIRAFIVTPNMHRVHHSIELRELNSNFTSTLSLWDRLNGTFKKRDNTLTITIGLPVLRERKWQGLSGFIITPFVRSE
ncbi:MAG: hypothetical protein A2077_02800 [Nitrospirae bacterium GWC2_46_6]|nr:MAG: hypothetical protein A2077_02800 [Nitrospirae bacterium GWC2_46_6]OGW22441.1 MAG: hypothetical protein A2Z82_08320 [Nitrospirae bacterium GWA2_46_11]OGW23353.1 MAG: hypothetical protein A2X55_10870 [Nitrospirae bacterium GWB2_47_37]HAK87789.1 sterol desaturase family protein [Nitrospiraceae bacterium]HCL81399.1 sterol desaturase family protein [Nitrospiraceae bacterium]